MKRRTSAAKVFRVSAPHYYLTTLSFGSVGASAAICGKHANKILDLKQLEEAACRFQRGMLKRKIGLATLEPCIW